ncbi:MAG: ABC-type transport auxiliary lipoprotein family protein [Thiohalomonadaceae bacterium]
MRGRLHLLLWLAALAALSGCVPFAGRPEPQAQYIYLLQGAEAVPALNNSSGCHVLLINSPRAVPGFATSGFAYRQSDARIQYFAYHRWSDSPARMLQPLLVSAAERSKLFSGVITPGAPVQGDVRLDSEVVDLSQRFDDGSSEVRFAVRVRLYGQERLLAGETFEATESAEPNPQSGIEAANRASAKVLERIIRFIQATLQNSGLRCPAAGPDKN